ncbi:MAG: Uncharacterised protein [Marinobacterium sp. xm-d-530]|nr:MAG: Uncharacterised protein [Marinobacterium sp. xm-d-530]
MLQTVQELNDFLTNHFPQGEGFGAVEEAGDGWVLMRLTVEDSHLRPGGTVSGPTMMGMADVAIWSALQTKIGPSPMTVTGNLNINFLSKPKPVDMLARARVLRVGRRNGVGECYIYSGDEDSIVAHVTATYSIPAK